MVQLMKQNLRQLSKIISLILRHKPDEYDLKLDNEGWVSVYDLLHVLQKLKPDWNNLEIEDLEEVIVSGDKCRHEIKNDKIRALYGHSTPQKLLKEETEPPMFLYHGTASKLSNQIKKEGLLPMRRQYVHLSAAVKTACEVGRRKSSNTIILKIKAKEAFKDGHKFYHGNESIWLADYVLPKYIEKHG
jgi:putative RNA 2'-phosphotransferase